jgi:signal transduction histidine kinase
MVTDDYAATRAGSAVEGAPSGSLLTRVAGMARLLREREEARARAQADAQAARRMEAFLGVATRELRNPVTASRIGVRLAARRLDVLLDEVAAQDPELACRLAATQDLLTTAEADLERLTRLVNDLLDVSRMRAGELAVRPTRGDLRAFVWAAVDEQRHLAPARRIRLHLPALQPVLVWADADRIHEVVTNYLTNALKYAPADRPVDVRVQARAGWARVAVRDQGPGLSRADQERIWEPFQRATGVSVAGGAPHGAVQDLGLGLYICKLIIEQHHGEVGVQSAPGRGSTFWFALPAICSDDCCIQS